MELPAFTTTNSSCATAVPSPAISASPTTPAARRPSLRLPEPRRPAWPRALISWLLNSLSNEDSVWCERRAYSPARDAALLEPGEGPVRPGIKRDRPAVAFTFEEPMASGPGDPHHAIPT